MPTRSQGPDVSSLSSRRLKATIALDFTSTKSVSAVDDAERGLEMGDHEIVRRLFAGMTATLEDAHELAIVGQSQIVAGDECQKASDDVSRLANMSRLSPLPFRC